MNKLIVGIIVGIVGIIFGIIAIAFVRNKKNEIDKITSATATEVNKIKEESEKIRKNIAERMDAHAKEFTSFMTGIEQKEQAIESTLGKSEEEQFHELLNKSIDEKMTKLNEDLKEYDNE